MAASAHRAGHRAGHREDAAPLTGGRTMPTTVTAQQWRTIRETFDRVGNEFADLVRAGSATRSATPHWSVADTAAHVATLLVIDVGIVNAADRYHFPFPEAEHVWQVTTVDTVNVLNDVVMAGYPVREPLALAEAIRRDVDQVLRQSAELDPGMAVAWLGSSMLPVAGVLAHMVNEFQIHGHDIARAIGRPWHVDPAAAGLMFEHVIVGILHHDYGCLLDTQRPLPDVRVAVEFRSAHTVPAILLLDHNRVSLAPQLRPDVRLTFDPVVLNLMLFGRISRLRAVLGGGVKISGRRPWLLPAFLRKVRLPS